MPSAGYKLVRLASGVHSVHSLQHRETFHPVVGPVAEANALYVEQLKLRQRLRGQAGQFVVWDIGLGAAANAVTVLGAARDISCAVRLVSFDHTIEPLQFALEHTGALGYIEGYAPQLKMLAERHEVTFVNGRQTVRWELSLGDFPSLLATSAARDLPKPHAILFDAFSPAKNPAMWTLPLFTRLFQLLDPGRPCAMPTYSRSTMLRVTLLLAGFYVGAGHATGEKEETTIAANSPDLIDEPLDPKWLQRARRSSSAEPLREPVYRQAPLSSNTWARLERHPQFN
ncbi:MAG TPA: MnmC family methyltransferase [Verrucomicrobiae bacterium]|nr:MnmC family methyltransferase [Verrucomicrobiae bacterium]